MSNQRKELICSVCGLQFRTDFVFGLHLSLVHEKKKKSGNLVGNPPLETNFNDETKSKEKESKPFKCEN